MARQGLPVSAVVEAVNGKLATCVCKGDGALNGHRVLATIAGRLSRAGRGGRPRVKILPGDMVRVDIAETDPSRGILRRRLDR